MVSYPHTIQAEKPLRTIQVRSRPTTTLPDHRPASKTHEAIVHRKGAKEGNGKKQRVLLSLIHI